MHAVFGNTAAAYCNHLFGNSCSSLGVPNCVLKTCVLLMTSQFLSMGLVKRCLKGRLLVLTGLLLGLGLAIVFGLVFYTVRTQADENVRRTTHQLTAVVGLVSLGHQQTLDRTEQLLSAIANVPVLKNVIAPHPCSAFLSSLQGDAKRYASLVLINLAGQPLCQAKLGLSDPPNAHIELVSKVIDTQSFEWGPYRSGVQNETPSIGAAAPVYSESGELVGVVVAALQLDPFQAEQALGQTAHNATAVSVIDREGVIVDTASVENGSPGARLPAAVFGRLLPKRGAYTFETPDATGVDTVYAGQAVLASNVPVLYVVANARREATGSTPAGAAANPLVGLVGTLTLACAGLLAAMVYRRRRRHVLAMQSAQPVTQQLQSSPATGQQDTVDRLGDSEAMLDAATSRFHVGAWRIRIPGLEMAWSRELCVIHKVPAGYEPTLERTISFYVPEHRSVIRRLLDRCALMGEGFEAELKLVNALEETLFVKVVGHAVRDAAGAITQVQGALQDISGMRRAEASQLLTAQRLATTLETISDALVIFDQSWCVTYVNAQAEKLLLRRRDTLLNKNLWDEFPDLKDTLFEMYYRAAVRTLQPQQFEAFYAPLALWLDVSACPSDEGLVVHFRNVTQRRADQAQLLLLSAAVARISDMVVITEAEPIDRPGPRIVYVNDAFQRLTGYTRAEVVGKSPSLLQGPKTNRAELDRIRVALQAWQPVRAELLNYTKAGKEFWVELDIAPIANAKGWYTHWVAIERDVTERRAGVHEILRLNSELEDNVAQRTAQLTAVNKELEAFSYSVSHDLRAPLVAVGGFAALLSKREAHVLSDQAQHYLKRIHAGVSQMNELIDGLLALAKSASEPITRQRVDLSALAHRMARECQERDPERHVMFSIQEGIHADADPLLMSVVLHNLISNACKFSVNTPAARVEFGQEADAAGQPTYFVKDNGAGFDEAYAHHLFGLFQRLHTAEEFGGTGIGLANVKRVIGRHGGTVWAHGKVGEGAVFYFTLGSMV